MRRTVFNLICIVTFVALLVPTPDVGAQDKLPIVDSQSAGFDSSKLSRIPTIVEAAISKGDFPGCVICFGHQNQIAYLKAFGDRQVEPVQQDMTTDTVFDMASITKPVATATSVMILVDRGQVQLSDHIADYFPAFGCRGKEAITVRHLLIHQSGLIPDNALADYRDGPNKAWQNICGLGLVCDVGTQFKYSDVNFIVLAKLVQKISGKDVHQFSQQSIFRPLGMTETGYVPDKPLRDRAAATEQRNGAWIQGQVHDPRAFRLDGIAGHAGLFSTASDMAVYSSMMLGQGSLSGDVRADGQPVKILSESAWQQMTKVHVVSSGQRGLGWDKQTGYSSNKGNRLSDAAFGHGGFTGTVLWIDPEQDLYFVFLSSRLHPDGKGQVNRLAGQILDIVVDGMIPSDH